MSNEEFLIKESERAHKLFATKHKPGFTTRESFSKWFRDQLLKQDFKCHYCETSILDIRRLIESNTCHQKNWIRIKRADIGG